MKDADADAEEVDEDEDRTRRVPQVCNGLEEKQNHRPFANEGRPSFITCPCLKEGSRRRGAGMTQQRGWDDGAGSGVPELPSSLIYPCSIGISGTYHIRLGFSSTLS